MQSRYNKFSKMSWLKQKVFDNNKSKDKNPKSILYYGVLKQIKYAQDNNLITDELYACLSSWNDKNSVAYGYYTANIHYDLFTCCNKSTRNALDDRIIDFLKITEKTYLNESWFKDNFIYSFTNFLKLINKKIDLNLENDLVIELLGNDKEKEILRLYEKI